MLDLVKSDLGTEAASDDARTHSCAAIRSELKRILASSQFHASERNCRFFEHVVEETLMGRDNRIKAYTIATTVFGRSDCFDGTLDPVVRMEARRLRRALERFYLVEGDGDGVRISLPKGGYVPKFDRAPPRRRTIGSPLRDVCGSHSERRGPTILICPFAMEFKGARDVTCNEGLSRQIVIGLTLNQDLVVYMPSPMNRNVDTDFVSEGNTALGPHVLNVKATLLDVRTGEVCWAQSFVSQALTQQAVLDTRDDIAGHIVCALSRRFFMILSDDDREPQ